jgi:hypothetical protein
MPLTSAFGEANRDLTVSAFPALAARNSASVSGVRAARLAALHPKIMNSTENTMLRYRMRFMLFREDKMHSFRTFVAQFMPDHAACFIGR